MATVAAKQNRSVKTRDRILASAKTVLEEEGFDAFTLAKVAIRAEVAVGSIYHRIGSKEELFRAVYDSEMDAIHQEMLVYADATTWAPLSADETIRRAIEVMAAFNDRHAAFLRVAIARSMVDPEIIAAARVHTTRLAWLFDSVLLSKRDAFTHPDPETGVDICFRLVFSTLTRRVTHGPTFESPVAISDEDLVENLARACQGLLLRYEA